MSIRVWLGADGRLRGVASLDALSPEEFIDAFRRWPVSLKRIEAADVDGAIYAAIARRSHCGLGRTGRLSTGQVHGEAADFRRQTSARLGVIPTQAVRVATVIEPMPVLI